MNEVPKTEVQIQVSPPPETWGVGGNIQRGEFADKGKRYTPLSHSTSQHLLILTLPVPHIPSPSCTTLGLTPRNRHHPMLPPSLCVPFSHTLHMHPVCHTLLSLIPVYTAPLACAHSFREHLWMAPLALPASLSCSQVQIPLTLTHSHTSLSPSAALLIFTSSAPVSRTLTHTSFSHTHTFFSGPLSGLFSAVPVDA